MGSLPSDPAAMAAVDSRRLLDIAGGCWCGGLRLREVACSVLPEYLPACLPVHNGLPACPQPACLPASLNLPALHPCSDALDYCANNVANGVIVLAALGTILRLGAALALAFCPRGLRLEPAVAAVARWLLPRRRRRRGARAATASCEGEQAPATP